MERQTPGLPSTPVRDSVRELIPHLSYVEIDEGAIKDLSGQLVTEGFELLDWAFDPFLLESERSVPPDDIIDYFFIGNSINYQFRDHETGEKFKAAYDGNEESGAFAMWLCLRRAYEQGEDILEGSYLAALSEDGVSRLFEPSNGVTIPMLESRVEILNSVGQKLEARYDGRFSNFLSQVPNQLFDDGAGMVEQLISGFPSFDDTAELKINGKRKEIHLYKRAQLAPAMTYGRFADSDHFTVTDPESFTIFADYNLPNVLRWHGVLRYHPDLAEKIADGTPLAPYSRTETEIRAATIYAADQLISQVNAQLNRPINAAHMDAKLFMDKDEADTPIHRTKTTAY